MWLPIRLSKAMLQALDTQAAAAEAERIFINKTT